MRVTIYDRKPGVGLSQWGLMFSWWLGCWFQKLIGKVDEYYGAESWEDAVKWLLTRRGELTSIQYWGHGSPGVVWLAQKAADMKTLLDIKPKVTADTILWFRTCSTFQGQRGFDFTKQLADGLGCTVGGHTRIIGPLQGGLHTRKPGTEPSWPLEEGEFPPSKWPAAMRWGNNTITCLRTSIPKGW